MTDRTDDADSMRRLKAGDAAALEILLALHGQALFAYLMRLCGSEPRAEDVYQNTWLRVFSRASTFREGASVKAWVFRIAHNAAMDTRRRESLRETMSLDDEDRAPIRPTSREPGPDRLASGREEIGRAHV